MDSSGTSGHRQRLRERFLREDAESRSEVALLELLLTYAIPQRDVRAEAEALLARLGGLDGVLSASAVDLAQVKGIKETAATLVKLVEAIRSHGLPRVASKPEPVALPKPVVGPVRQPELFEGAHEAAAAAEPESTEGPKPPRRPPMGIFGKALLKETIEQLPGLPDAESLDAIREHLRQSLRVSAASTRQRNANYIVRRMFPSGTADIAMRAFARRYEGSRDLAEACFYRFLKAEPLVEDVIHEVVLPAIGTGKVRRERIRQYLGMRFPEAKSIGDCAKGIVDALCAGGIAHTDHVQVSFSYREVSLAAFAFVVHSEFEPGIHGLAKLEQSRTIRAMLWHPERIKPAVYELRNRGLLSKVSEIDSVRQFTVRYSLAEAVAKLVSGAGGAGG